MASILVVDDEPSARATLALLLRRRGHRVREAAGVVAAVGLAAEDTFDVVVTDLRMPDGGGLDVLRAVRAHQPEADVFLLTAYAGWESAVEAMRLGAVDYVEKGDAPEALLRRIDEALAEQARRRAPPPPHAALLAEERGQRAVVTVLFADLRGSLELLATRALDEARAVVDDVLRLMMDAVHRRGGTVNQVMGDGIMALFGAPITAPDHAARACAAALDMQRAVQAYAARRQATSGEGNGHRAAGVGVQIRVGLNTGEVMLRSIPSDVRRDYTAVGLATHVAARMEQMARPGTVLATAATLEAAGAAALGRPVGHVAVRGLDAGVEAFEVVAVREPAAATA